jgi:DNA-binding LacI/PurR family transcriptional regulator
MRPTIDDIARSAGVSKGAVSFALNDRPGVSASTRARILSVASDMGWLPNVAARALAGAGTRSGAIGFVLARPLQVLGNEPYFMHVIAGISGELASRSQSLVLKVVKDHAAEIATYRRWWAERRVDGVVLVDPHIDDDRIGPLTALKLPAVFMGISPATAQFGGVWTDESASMKTVLQHLADLGHTSVARVAGDARHDHVAVRTEAFHRWAAVLGLDGMVVATDFSGEQGAQATLGLLRSSFPPSAIIFENDIMALAGISATRDLGLRVPEDVSLVAWDDSTLCEISSPPITAMQHDVREFAATAARVLLDWVEGGAPRREVAPLSKLIVRGSTARRS